jgi:hypothetical protein
LPPFNKAARSKVSANRIYCLTGSSRFIISKGLD